MADETLSQVFNISSQWKQNLRNKRIRSSTSMLIKTEHPNLLDFLCLNLTNYFSEFEKYIVYIYTVNV